MKLGIRVSPGIIGLTCTEVTAAVAESKFDLRKSDRHHMPGVPGLADADHGVASAGNAEKWVAHYNHGRPHSSLGSGVPGTPQPELVNAKPTNFRHELGEGVAVCSNSVLGGPHYEYSLVPAVA